MEGGLVIKNLATELKEFICDDVCKHRVVLEQNELDKVCSVCVMSNKVDAIVNEYERLNTFDNTQTFAVLEKFSEIVLCSECDYRTKEQEKCLWYKETGAISKKLSANDGCSRGKKTLI